MHFKKSLLASGIFFGSFCHAADINQSVFFGDSLTDSGYYTQINANIGKFTTNPDKVWSEVLADHLGATANPSNNGQNGTNYAVGGAKSAEDTVNFGISVPSAQSQVQNYLANHQINPNALYTVWIGANDLLAVAQNPANATSVITAAAQNTVGTVKTLHDNGAKVILVPNLPDVGLTPQATALGINAQATAATQLYNSSIYNGLLTTSANVVPLDTFSLLQEVAQNPSIYGFSNTTSTACTGSSAICTDKGGSDYLFADGIHPTGKAHKVVGDYAYGVLSAPVQIGQISQSLITHGQNKGNFLHQRLHSDRQHQQNFWATGTLTQQKNTQGKSSNKTDNINSNIQVGIDTSKNNYTLGAYLNYQNHDQKWQQGGKFDVDSMGLGIYHQQRFGKMHLNTQIGMDKLTINTHRQIALGQTFRSHKARANGHHMFVDMQAGFNMGNFTPYLGVNAQHVKIGQLLENDKTATSMQFDKHTQKEIFAKAGVMGQLPISQNWQVFGDLGFSHRLVNDELAVKSRLQSISTPNRFSLTTPKADKTSVYGSVGVKTAIGKADLYANLQGQTSGSDNTDVSGLVGVSYGF